MINKQNENKQQNRILKQKNGEIIIIKKTNLI